MSSHRQPRIIRAAFTLIEILVVIAIIGILIALLVPAVQKVRYAAARSQSTNNLKQLALGSHAFHDTTKALPFNGSVDAANGNAASGSWAFQILPYIEQTAIFDAPGSATSLPIPALLCAMRSRPGYYIGGAVAPFVVNGTITHVRDGSWSLLPVPVVTKFTVSPGTDYTFSTTTGYYSVDITNNVISNVIVDIHLNSGIYSWTAQYTTPISDVRCGDNGTFVIRCVIFRSGTNDGPATDFGMNPYLNSPTGTLHAKDIKRTLVGIQDGSSNTILLGHIYVARSDYPLTTAASANAQLPIFRGGQNGTSRNGLGDTAATWLMDGTATALNQWGSPMTEGGLMAMGDGTIRVFPYQVPLTNYLKPDDNIAVDLP